MASSTPTTPEPTYTLDLEDRWRIGGPGKLPQWPIHEHNLTPEEIKESGIEHVKEVVVEQINKRALLKRLHGGIEAIEFKGRHTVGYDHTPADHTLYIKVNMVRDRATWTDLLRQTLTEIEMLYFRGRIEIIHHTAHAGKMTQWMPPGTLSEQQYRETTRMVYFSLGRFLHCIRGVMYCMRGYHERPLTPTVCVAAWFNRLSPSDRDEFERVREDLTKRMRGEGFDFEVIVPMGAMSMSVIGSGDSECASESSSMNDADNMEM